MHRATIAALSLAMLLLGPQVGWATTAADIQCDPPGPDPCVLSKVVTVTAGSTLDFGMRAFQIKGSGGLKIGAGDTLTIFAKSVTLQPGALIQRALSASAAVTVTIETMQGIDIQRSPTNSRGRIDVSADAGGGTINLTAHGDLNVSGDLLAKGNTTEGNGGEINLSADGNATIGGNIQLFGMTDGIGGDLTITAKGSLLVSPPTGSTQIFDASGGLEGGTMDIEAGPSLIVDGVLNVAGVPSTGAGAGLLTMNSTGNIKLTGPIRAGGSGSTLFGGGDGGDILVTANGTIELDGDVDFSSGAPDGFGGNAEFTADVDVMQAATSHLLGQGGGDQACGGGLSLGAGQLLKLQGVIDLHGADACGGGEVSGSSGGEIQALGEINANGDAGFIGLTTIGPLGDFAFGPVTVGGNLHAGGADIGVIDIRGCDLTLTFPGGMVKTSGSDSMTDNFIQASGRMTLGGTLTSLPAGHNMLRYLSTPPTIQATAAISPIADQQADATIPPCYVAPPPICGNSVIEAGEDCDDGNTTPCDGCNASCHLEVCGNGVTDCPAGIGAHHEECDDGNAVEGDGCDSNCTRSACGNGILGGAEQCDDGNRANGDGCDSDCHIEPPANCGDGHLDADEQCDDGNTVPCDGCSQFCTLETCGNNIVDCPAGAGPHHEQCDDGNTDNCDGCSSTCRTETCGNGVLDCGEECEPRDASGNVVLGCNGFCKRCDVGSPGCPCELNTDCAALGACGGFACDTISKTCVSVAIPACDDHNVCNGTEKCRDLPDQGRATCDPGTPLQCTPDPCLEGTTCDPVNGCPSTFKTGLAAILCKLDALDGVVQAASAADLMDKPRQKITGMSGKIRSTLQQAQALTGKKLKKKLKATGKQLKGIGKAISRGLAKKQIGTDVAARLNDALTGANKALQDSLAS